MEKSIKELRAMTGLTQTEFGKRLGGIPLRTIQNWENGVSAPPKWALELIAFRVEHDDDLTPYEEIDFHQREVRTQQYIESVIPTDYKPNQFELALVEAERQARVEAIKKVLASHEKFKVGMKQRRAEKDKK